MTFQVFFLIKNLIEQFYFAGFRSHKHKYDHQIDAQRDREPETKQREKVQEQHASQLRLFGLIFGLLDAQLFDRTPERAAQDEAVSCIAACRWRGSDRHQGQNQLRL